MKTQIFMLLLLSAILFPVNAQQTSQKLLESFYKFNDEEIDTVWHSGYHDLTEYKVYKDGTLIIFDYENKLEQIIPKGLWEYSGLGVAITVSNKIICRTETERDLISLLRTFISQHYSDSSYVEPTFSDFIEFLRIRSLMSK